MIMLCIPRRICADRCKPAPEALPQDYITTCKIATAESWKEKSSKSFFHFVIFLLHRGTIGLILIFDGSFSRKYL